MTRPVYLLHEGGDTPLWALCEPCIAATIDPAAARADIVRRDDSAHCVGCDYHADPSCGPASWCDTARRVTVCDDCGAESAVPCPWNATTCSECSMMRERSVAGRSDVIPSCAAHGAFLESED